MANASDHTYIFKIAERSQTVMPLSGIWGSISTKWVGFGVKLEFLAGLRRGRRPNAISEEFSHFTPIPEALEPPEEKNPKIRLSTCMVHRIWEPNPYTYIVAPRKPVSERDTRRDPPGFSQYILNTETRW